MDRRGNHGPMDFTYDNGIGPVNPASPFMNVARNNDGLKRPFVDLSPGKRTSSDQSLPTSSSYANPFPRSQETIKARPQAGRAGTAPVIDFFTPRRPQTTFDFDTSGAETPNTPDHPDSDATPDNRMNTNGFVFNAGQESPTGKKKDGRRDTFFTRMNIFGTNPSAGRGEIPRGAPHAHKIEKRAPKRRNGKAVALVRPKRKPQAAEDDEYIDIDSDSDEPQVRQLLRSPKKNRKASSPRKASHHNNGPESAFERANGFGSFFSYLESHPNLPAVLSWYAQLLCNCFFVFIIMYFVYSAYTTIQADVDEAAASASAEVLTEIAKCAKQYKENECDGARVLPAMVNLCKNWEACMARDPRRIGRARVSAHTFARIFNSFVEPISWKAMVFSLLVIFGTAAVSNFAFGFFRSRHAGAASFQPQQPQMYYQSQIPATPSFARHASGGTGAGGGGLLLGTGHGQEHWMVGYPHDPSTLTNNVEPAVSEVPRDAYLGSPSKKSGFI